MTPMLKYIEYIHQSTFYEGCKVNDLHDWMKPRTDALHASTYYHMAREQKHDDESKHMGRNICLNEAGIQKVPLQWSYNESDGVWYLQRLHCLFNRLFSRRSKKTSKHSAPSLCEGNPPVTSIFPHKGPVTWKMFLFDNVIIRRNIKMRERKIWIVLLILNICCW